MLFAPWHSDTKNETPPRQKGQRSISLVLYHVCSGVSSRLLFSCPPKFAHKEMCPKAKDDYHVMQIANILGVEVKAPDDSLHISKNGGFYVGDFRDGKFVSFHPNQRRRIK